jgi:hypothetical protein
VAQPEGRVCGQGVRAWVARRRFRAAGAPATAPRSGARPPGSATMWAAAPPPRWPARVGAAAGQPSLERQQQQYLPSLARRLGARAARQAGSGLAGRWVSWLVCARLHGCRPHLHRERGVPQLAAVVALHLEPVLRDPQVVVHARQVPGAEKGEARGQSVGGRPACGRGTVQTGA